MQTRVARNVRERRGKAAGFTLVELMVVVAIVGITAGLALVYLDSGKRGREVEGFTDRIAGQFSMARQRAVATQKRQRIEIGPNGFVHFQNIEEGLAPNDLTDGNNWDYVYEAVAPLGVTIAAVSNRLHTDSDDSVPGVSSDDPIISIDLMPDGRARTAAGGSFFEPGWTVFVQDDDGVQARALLFGVTGATTVYNGW